MKARVKKRISRRVPKTSLSTRRSVKVASAIAVIRQTGNDWAGNWNAGDLDSVVAAYAPDAVYLPPHHEAVHGRDSIRQYLQGPLSHGVTDLVFDVTYIKQAGGVAWDVGTYRMSVPQNDGTRREDHGKYLTLWRRVGTKWLIAADAWSSDLPVAH